MSKLCFTQLILGLVMMIRLGTCFMPVPRLTNILRAQRVDELDNDMLLVQTFDGELQCVNLKTLNAKSVRPKRKELYGDIHRAAFVPSGDVVRHVTDKDTQFPLFYYKDEIVVVSQHSVFDFAVRNDLLLILYSNREIEYFNLEKRMSRSMFFNNLVDDHRGDIIPDTIDYVNGYTFLGCTDGSVKVINKCRNNYIGDAIVGAQSPVTSFNVQALPAGNVQALPAGNDLYRLWVCDMDGITQCTTFKIGHNKLVEPIETHIVELSADKFVSSINIINNRLMYRTYCDGSVVVCRLSDNGSFADTLLTLPPGSCLQSPFFMNERYCVVHDTTTGVVNVYTIK